MKHMRKLLGARVAINEREEVADLLSGLLHSDPTQRLAPTDALQHIFFGPDETRFENWQRRRQG